MNATSVPTQSAPTRRLPPWFRAMASLGILWNSYGAFQFVSSVIATQESLVAMGMTELHARTMSSYPVWMTAAFAVGTIGGLVGSLLLLARRRVAVPVFIASLAGYVLLYVGDITEGVFAASGTGQVVILSLVVAVAAGLLLMSRRAASTGILA